MKALPLALLKGKVRQEVIGRAGHCNVPPLMDDSRKRWAASFLLIFSDSPRFSFPFFYRHRLSSLIDGFLQLFPIPLSCLFTQLFTPQKKTLLSLAGFFLQPSTAKTPLLAAVSFFLFIWKHHSPKPSPQW